MERISGETIVLYAELRQKLETVEAMRGISSLHGQFTQKKVRGNVYHYFQTLLPTGRAQIYLGPDTEEIRRLINEYKSGKRDAQLDEGHIQRLAAQIIAGGIVPIGPDMSRVMNRLADSGVYHVGGVLVGSIAFHILGIHLGVQWDTPLLTTQDVDIAGSRHISLAVPDVKADIPAAVESLKMGFFPVPRLSHKESSTSYAIRGKALRIDLLTPSKSGRTAPVFIKRLNAAAQPLKYLDYLIEEPVHAAMISGTPCKVNIPQPARFALHKLLVSRERAVVSADKAHKDIAQAKALLGLLKQDRPGDIILAREALEKKGTSWVTKLKRAAKECGVEI